MRIQKIERSVEVSAEKERYEIELLVYCCYCKLHLTLWGAISNKIQSLMSKPNDLFLCNVINGI